MSLLLTNITLNLFQVFRSPTLRVLLLAGLAPAAPWASLNWHAARPHKIPSVTAVSISSCGGTVTARAGCARPALCAVREVEWSGHVARWEIQYVSGANQGLIQRREATENPASPVHAVVMMRWRSDPASLTLTLSVWVSGFLIIYCMFVVIFWDV